VEKLSVNPLDIFISITSLGSVLGSSPQEIVVRFFFITWGFILILLALKKFEPLLMFPLGMGMILANIPGLHLARPPPTSGETIFSWPAFLYWIYHYVVATEIGPLLIFLGIGAISDFRPMLAYPPAVVIGAAAQLGIIVVSWVALALGFRLNEAMAVGVVGGADGPTTIYTATSIAPYLVGPLAIAVYSYIALIPLIQPPLIRVLVPKKYLRVRMSEPRRVSEKEIIVFWLVLIVVVAILVPNALPLVAALGLGNIFKESRITEVVERYAKTAGQQLLDIATILTMLGVGSTLSWDFLSSVAEVSGLTIAEFLVKAVLCLLLGLLAFVVSTVGGIAIAWMLYFVTGGRVNPAIGCAGVSAVPISARVAQREVSRVDPTNFVLLHALGPNVAGVIGTAIVAGSYIGFIRTYLPGVVR